MIRYEEMRPAGLLSVYIEAYWRFDVDVAAAPFEHTVPLTGGVVITAMPARRAVWITGPRVEPLRPHVSPGDVYCGAMLHPGAGAALLGLAGAALRGRQVMAGDVLGADWADALSQRLRNVVDLQAAAAVFDAAFTPMLGRAAPLDTAILRAVAAVCDADGALRIEPLARASGLAPRTLRRRFRNAVGLTPKELARVRRLHAVAVDTLREAKTSWSSLAAARGFADQAHLVDEFRQLTGLTPVAFAAYIRTIDHGPVEVGRFRQDRRDRPR